MGRLINTMPLRLLNPTCTEARSSHLAAKLAANRANYNNVG